MRRYPHLPARHSLALIAFAICLAGGARNASADDEDTRLDNLRQRFLAHVQAFGPDQALNAGLIAQNLQAQRDIPLTTAVPDALSLLYPDFRAALRHFDAGRHAAAASAFAPLLAHDDPYVAASALYFHTRAALAQGRFEDVETALADVPARIDEFATATPFLEHLLFLRAAAQTGNLRTAEAEQTLTLLHDRVPDAAELVRISAEQLSLEISRRERGTLGEVAELMDFSAGRLALADPSERLQEEQEHIIALLDKLIEENEQQEQQQQQQSGQGGSSRAQRQPRRGADESRLPEAGGGEFGPLHEAPEADPGEMWGRMPPAERQKILQSLRERFPSRYRQLVEQYYRSLAEEK